MRRLAILGLWIYGVANVVAGAASLLAWGKIPHLVALALITTGIFLAAAGQAVQHGSPQAFAVALIALLLALALAVFNERVLGLGEPYHHVVRGLITLLIGLAVWRGTRGDAQ